MHKLPYNSPGNTNTPKCRIHDVTYPEIELLSKGLRKRAASEMYWVSMQFSVLVNYFTSVNSAFGTFLTPPPSLGGGLLLEALAEELIFQGG